VIVPLLNVLPSEKSAIHVPDFLVALIGKLTCYAIVGVAMDLVWGYAGILSLCHGLFFALGGYAMGMYLMRCIGTAGMYRNALPDFMVFLDWKELPWYWRGFDHFGFALFMALFIPGLAAMLLFFRNATGFGGNNGLTDFKTILGYSLREPKTRAALCALSGLALASAYALCRVIIASRAGRVLMAMRDAQAKVRFCGYNVTSYQLFAWTLSAVLCGIAGALYVPQVGIINPSEMQPSNSVEMAIWVAVGGRGTLAGAILGALLVNGAKSWLTVAFPTAWLYVLGALFVAVTLLIPGGVVRLFASLAAVRNLAGRLGGSGRSVTGARRSSAPPPPKGAVLVGKERQP
jgi:urea transport system permease protein